MVKKLDRLEIHNLFLFAEKMAALKRSFLVRMAKRALLHKIKSFNETEEGLAKTYEIVHSLSVFQDDKEILEAIFHFHMSYAIHSREKSPKQQEAILTSYGDKFLALQVGEMQKNDYKNTKLLSHCPNLRKLVLENMDITESTVIEVANSCPNLQSLCIKSCAHFNEHELVHFSALPALQCISLSFCANLTNNGLSSLVSLTSLKEVNIGLSFNTFNITGACLSGLTHLESLSFDAYNRDLTVLDLSYLNSLTALRRLSVFVGKELTIQSFGSLTSLSALQKLELMNFVNLQNADLTHLKIFPRLQVLSLKSCHNLHSVASLTALTALRALEVVFCDLSSCLTDIQHLTALRKLNLSETFGFGDKDLHYLTSLTNLKKLELSTSTTFKGSGLMQLAPLTNLQTLAMRGCLSNGSHPLEFHLPYLKLSGC